MAAFAKAFINEGIAVGGDVPQDPKFWQNLKKEYLNNPEHSIDNWQHLTRKVPPQYMGEMKNEHSLSPTQATNPRAASGSFIKQLRNGNNPKLTPQQNKPQQRSNGNQPLSVHFLISPYCKKKRERLAPSFSYRYINSDIRSKHEPTPHNASVPKRSFFQPICRPAF